MSAASRRCLLRLLPLAVAIAAVIAWFWRVEAGGPWALRNALPPAAVFALSVAVLVRGGGYWTGAGWRMPLALLGFAIPALGLAIYLHFTYAADTDGQFADGPGQLFRWLPVYTTGAGAIGAAIGWIAGRNVT